MQELRVTQKCNKYVDLMRYAVSESYTGCGSKMRSYVVKILVEVTGDKQLPNFSPGTLISC
jgi:hypothetical protein